MIIIYNNLDYNEALTIAGLSTVKQRRIDMCKKLFTQMQNDHANYYLLRKKIVTALEHLINIKQLNVKQITTNKAFLS